MIKSLDVLSISGLAIAVFAVVGGNHLEGGAAESLWELTALVIVLGGTLGATLLQTPFSVFARALRLLKWTFLPPKVESEKFVADIVRWSDIVRHEGLIGLDGFVEREKDPFTKKALRMLADGNEPRDIRSVMEVYLIAGEKSDHDAANVFEGMGGYSPTIGILGAVLGLIHVMNNLEDPSKLGAGIATAFVATIYGVGFANLLFLPIANKLRNIVSQQVQIKELMLDGIIAIAEGEHPHNVKTRLIGYFGSR